MDLSEITLFIIGVKNEQGTPVKKLKPSWPSICLAQVLRLKRLAVHSVNDVAPNEIP